MKKIWGYISLGYAYVVKYFFITLIYIFEIVTGLSEGIRALLLPLMILMLIGVLIFPLLFIALGSLGAPMFIVFFLTFIIAYLGRRSLVSLRKVEYASNKYNFAYANDILNDTNIRKTYQEYEQEYIDKLRREFERQRQKEEEERRKRQQAENERWQRIFEEYFRTNGGSSGGYNQGGYNQGGYNQGGYGSSYNPFSQFKKQYEDACDVLGVPYNSDFSEIRSKYRILAKKYHPDLSKEKNAEEMFKKINNAFDFLSEENVRRYKNM